MISSIEDTIRKAFSATLDEQGQESTQPLCDNTILLQSGLDSLGFAILVTRLEDELGYDPFSLSDTPYYPQTFRDFVEFYERHHPSNES